MLSPIQEIQGDLNIQYHSDVAQGWKQKEGNQ